MSENIALCYSKGNTYPVDRNDKQALACHCEITHILEALSSLQVRLSFCVLIAMTIITLLLIGRKQGQT